MRKALSGVPTGQVIAVVGVVLLVLSAFSSWAWDFPFNLNWFSEMESNQGIEQIQGADIVEVDGCEYIRISHWVGGGNGMESSLTHKGNCKNPSHGNFPVKPSEKTDGPSF